jgi:putative FmdB family regulatory protein
MPIYEYNCRKCGAHVEILQKLTDKPLTKCKKCGGRLEKVWSRTGFQFKGSGWYVTDYAGRKRDAKAEGKDAKPDAGAAAAKADAKAETKSEAAPAAKKTSKADVTSKGASAD